MCTRGSELTSRPLPSFVTRQTEPVSPTPKLAPGDADVGVEEDLPELAARRLRERLELRRDGLALDRREELGDVLGRLLDRGRDDVDGVLAGELDDVLAEIGLDDAHPGRLERVVEPDLLGHHRLRLRGELRAGATRRRRRRRRSRPRRCARSGHAPPRASSAAVKRATCVSRSSITRIRASWARWRSSSTSSSASHAAARLP